MGANVPTVPMCQLEAKRKWKRRLFQSSDTRELILVSKVPPFQVALNEKRKHFVPGDRFPRIETNPEHHYFWIWTIPLAPCCVFLKRVLRGAKVPRTFQYGKHYFTLVTMVHIWNSSVQLRQEFKATQEEKKMEKIKDEYESPTSTLLAPVLALSFSLRTHFSLTVLRSLGWLQHYCVLPHWTFASFSSQDLIM